MAEAKEARLEERIDELEKENAELLEQISVVEGENVKLLEQPSTSHVVVVQELGQTGFVFDTAMEEA